MAATKTMTKSTPASSLFFQDFVIFSISSQDAKIIIITVVLFSFHKTVMSGECLAHSIFCFDKGG